MINSIKRESLISSFLPKAHLLFTLDVYVEPALAEAFPGINPIKCDGNNGNHVFSPKILQNQLPAESYAFRYLYFSWWITKTYQTLIIL